MIKMSNKYCLKVDYLLFQGKSQDPLPKLDTFPVGVPLEVQISADFDDGNGLETIGRVSVGRGFSPPVTAVGMA